MDRIETRSYDDFKSEFIADPIRAMKQAANHEMNLSQYANAVAPSVLLEERRSVTNKLIEDLGFVVKESSVAKATPYERFAETTHGRAIAYDYLYRNFYKGHQRVNPMLPNSNTDQTLYPDGVSVPRFDPEIQPRFDPDTLVAMTTPVNGSTYKVFRWKGNQSDLERERVLPASKLPTMALNEQEAPVNIYKYGIAAEVSYEAIRRLALDKVGAMLQLEMNADRVRQLKQYIGVLKDGDERNGQKASDGTTLNTVAVGVTRQQVDAGSSAGEITLKGLMNWFAGWPQGYACNYVICRATRAVDIALLTNGNQNTPLAFLTGVSAPGIPGFSIPGIGGQVTVLIANDDDIGANELLGIDSNCSS